MAEQIFDPRRANLGEILVRLGVITQEQLQQALTAGGANQKNLGQVLVSLGFTTEEKIMKAVSVRLSVPYFVSFEGMIEPTAVKLLPESVARKHLAIPLFRSGDSLTVGFVNPLDLDAIDTVARETGLRVLPVMTTLSNIFDSIQRVYSTDPESAGPLEAGDGGGPGAAVLGGEGPSPLAGEGVGLPPEPARSPGEISLSQLSTALQGALPTSEKTSPKFRVQDEEKSAVDLVDAVLQEGMSRRASDIHIEPAEKVVRLRFRVDGMLQEGKNIEKSVEAAFVARIKILSKLDITETRLPQDGHLRFNYAGRGVDIRVSVLPTVHGEKVVLRILDSSTSIKKLAELGLSAPNLKSFAEAIRRPNGIVLVTGPTGSGKTTTLYAAVASLNDATRNIVTLEDPVEYRMDRVNQVETHTKIGLTFAAGLRSVLRQDPNVILVGEIRDLETAEIAVQAAITGHLVFSTLHTNDAVATIHRLINMRVEPFLLAAALAGVMAQRLVRRLCDRCKREHRVTKAEAEALGLPSVKAGAVFFEAVGCDACLKAGYSGRIAIHEWVTIGRTLRELILKRASIDEMRAAAKADGMISLQDDAVAKAAARLTSLEEVVRMTREDAQD